LHKGFAAAVNVRMDALMPKVIKQYIDLLQKTLKDNKMEESPAQIYNMDETGMAFEHRPPKVITMKGQKGKISHIWQQDPDNSSSLCEYH